MGVGKMRNSWAMKSLAWMRYGNAMNRTEMQGLGEEWNSKGNAPNQYAWA
jgi:hypothetical protein